MDPKIDEIVKRVIAESGITGASVTNDQEKCNVCRTAVLGEDEFDVVENPVPEINKDEILVKTEGALITPADVAAFVKEKDARRGADPTGFGTGTVVALGSDALEDVMGKGIHVGDKVIAVGRSGIESLSYNFPSKKDFHPDTWFSTYIVLKADKEVLVASALDPESRMLAGSALAIIRALDRTGKVSNKLEASSRVVVAGCTFTGFLTMAALRCMGIADVMAVGGSDKQIRMAERFGAKYVINYRDVCGISGVVKKEKETFSRGADVVFYCSGSDMGRNFAKRLASSTGYLCDFGFVLGKVDKNARYYEETMPLSNRIYTKEDYRKCLDFLERAKQEKLPLYELITHRYNLSQINDAFWTTVQGDGLGTVVSDR